MAFTILPPQRTWAESFGQGLESTLSPVLNALTQDKLNEIAQRQQLPKSMKALKALGFTQEEAEGLSHLPLELQAVFAKEKAKAKSLAPYMDKFQAMYGQPQVVQNEQEVPVSLQQQQQPVETQRLIKGLLEPKGITQQLQGLQGLFPNQQDMIMRTMEKAMQQPQRIEIAQPIQPQEQPKAVQPINKETELANTTKPGRPPLSQIEAAQMAASFATGDPKEILKTMRSIEKERAAESRFERQKSIESYKISKDMREKIIEEGKSAKSNLQDLERMEDLNQTGKLDTPGYVEFLKSTGLDIPALMNPESEEFQKIAQTFMRDAKKYFGGRVSNFEIEQFLKTIPSLSQSPEGRNRVIANLRRMNKGAVLYSKELKDLVKENKDYLPLDYLEQLDDRIEPKAEQLAKEFKKDLEKKVPAGQNKYITALQSIAGGIIGAPGKILSKVSGAAGKLLSAAE
jgi:hypothetical protein